MNTYIHGVFRSLANLRVVFDSNETSFVNEDDDGLATVMDNHSAEQTARGQGFRRRNTSRKGDVLSIFDSEYCSMLTYIGFRNRLFFALGLSIGTRFPVL